MNNVLSDEELDINCPLLTDDIESNHEGTTNETIAEYEKPNKKNFQIGTFVLVKVKFEKRGASTYTYLAVIQSIVDNCITVTGLKSIDTSKQIFKIVESDVFNVSTEHIEVVLKFSNVEGIGFNIRYTFAYSVDVQEA